MSKFIRYSSTRLPTLWGEFDVTVYQNKQGEEHIVISLGLLEREKEIQDHSILMRVHSACFTSEVLGSLKCDCREQLEYALQAIQQEGKGAVIYLFQEGRGIGLGAKIKAYALQEQGRDTVDANTELGYAEDARSYEMVQDIIQDLGIGDIRLLTNNPLKVNGLIELTKCTVERIPIEVGLNAINENYLKVKRDRMGHMFHENLDK